MIALRCIGPTVATDAAKYAGTLHKVQQTEQQTDSDMTKPYADHENLGGVTFTFHIQRGIFLMLGGDV